MYTTLLITIANSNASIWPLLCVIVQAAPLLFFTSLSSIDEYELVCPIYTTLTHQKATYFSIFMMFV